MKRYLIGLILLLTAQLCCGQINRSVGDVVLGQSKSGEVEGLLRDRDFQPQTSPLDAHLSVRSYTHSVKLANVECDQAEYFFFSDTCYRTLHSFSTGGSKANLAAFNKTKAALERKYGTLSQEKWDNALNEEMHFVCIISSHCIDRDNGHLNVYADPQTLILVDNLHLTISYIDRRLLREKKKADSAEVAAVRRLLGCELGQTGRSEAQAILYSTANAKPERSNRNFVEKLVNFGGAECKARLNFQNKKFYNASFQFQSTVNNTLFNYLKQALLQAYKGKCTARGKNHVEFDDGRTLVMLHAETDEKGAFTGVTLSYTDIDLLKDKTEVNVDEL